MPLQDGNKRSGPDFICARLDALIKGHELSTPASFVS